MNPSNVIKFKDDATLRRIEKLVNAELWEVMKECGCYIAGGALTSIYSSTPVNDLDIYFPNKEAVQKLLLQIYHEYDYGSSVDDISIDFRGSHIVNASARAILANSDGQDVQYIVYQFFDSPEEIFERFDFTVNMCAVNLNTGEFTAHQDFMRHNSQRYLCFNDNTSYPLMSALRVAKYTQRGYNISKSQMLRVLLAVNAKEIDSWNKLIDEVGGMYGTAPEEIFDVKQPFSLHAAMSALEEVEYSEKIKCNNPDLYELTLKYPHCFDEQFVIKLRTRRPWYKHKNFNHILNLSEKQS